MRKKKDEKQMKNKIKIKIIYKNRVSEIKKLNYSYLISKKIIELLLEVPFYP